ncbi:MAG: 2-polyprenyl-6-methoxyphenol hydroxylase-like oxidoreductase [Tildeniella nuda ZEHNDER 1965/U140]|jgi:2-polyprenyl-6-methoxyphenol hydroxylase-like FAD-dependent oxidoreductase|nr:2-polyprenyl-6-methoxyphenol hydroxylase-like oxidoreductase [Tildeniella nuda ZEHNDER 1965/U140]
MISLVADTSVDSPRRAIVIGGSMAGLLAARVLIDHFAEVVLIERDGVSDPLATRPGVPQSQHVHVLLTQGQRLLEQLFPGLAAALTAAGAPTVEWTADWLMLGAGKWLPRCSSDLSGRTCSRTLLEGLIRQRLLASPKLTLLTGCQVEGLLTTKENQRVNGVQLHWRTPDAASVPLLSAALVVDASGRNSALPSWLTQMGYDAPPETMINAFLGYASRWYERPKSLEADWQGITVAALEGVNSRGGVLYPIENDRWIVTLGGVGHDYPPTDETGFLAFARSLRVPILYDLLKEAQPLSPIYSYRRTENRWRHYERLHHMPEGIVALGDAVCAFNPVYGQGMTTAALSAMTLDRCLKQVQTQTRNHFSLRFHKQLARQLKTPWLMATGEDGRWSTTKGAQPGRRERLMQKYFDRVTVLMQDSPALMKTFAEVVHMVKPPTALLAPGIVLQVLASYGKRIPNTN